jgi:hypothetical protein
LLPFHGKSGYVNTPHCYVYTYIACLVINLLENVLPERAWNGWCSSSPTFFYHVSVSIVIYRRFEGFTVFGLSLIWMQQTPPKLWLLSIDMMSSQTTLNFISSDVKPQIT